VIEGWRRRYHAVRPHSALGYRPPPAPEVALWPAAQSRPAPPAISTVAAAAIMNQHCARTTRWAPASWHISDLNNIEVADQLSGWLKKHGLDER
jgi:hypothetical protein